MTFFRLDACTFLKNARNSNWILLKTLFACLSVSRARGKLNVIVSFVQSDLKYSQCMEAKR